jgi:3-oxoacyl-[acyl-carrier protein] reductase
MDLGLGKRHALVTGASRGLGRAIALALASEGAEVVAVARNLERLNELAREMPAGSGTIAAHACDLADASAVWSKQFEAMFLSAVRLTRLALPGMRRRGFGRILAVVSSGVIQPIPNLGISNALRAAVVGWAKTLAGEVAGEGVTVNCIAPGRIATDRVAELDQGRAKREGIDLAQVEKESRAVIPAGRYGDAAEFAAVTAFLASPRASYMTGGVIRVDGGMIRSV